MSDNFTRDLADEAATLHFGEVLAKAIQPNLTVYLHGDLGAGKTTLVRGLLHAMGHVGKVKSPTYTLVECYEISTYPIYHLDLYRLQDPIDILDMGLYDEFDLPAIWLIEWPERAMCFLPPPDIVLNFNLVGTNRQVQFDAKTDLGKQTLSLLHKTSS